MDESIAYAEKEPIVLLDVLPVEVSDTAALEPYKILDVQYEKNYAIDKEGICWVAVTASIIKYL